MVPDAYHDFFVAEAGAAAALIGLLFVAISVAPERISGPAASLVAQARASSALTCFLLPLALALVALLPGSHLAVPAIVLSVAGLLFVIATLRRYFSTPRDGRERLSGLTGLLGFTVVLVVTLAYGIVGIVGTSASDQQAAVAAISGTTIASILLGVERAWALIGGRSPSRAAVLRDIVQGERPGRDEAPQ